MHGVEVSDAPWQCDRPEGEPEQTRLAPVAHHGVRIASDQVPVDAAARSPEDVEPLVEVEVRLGDLDPYRQVATLAHLVYRRTSEPN